MNRELPWLTRRAQRWYERRTFGASDLPDDGVVAERKRADGTRVSVVLPALNEAETIGPICATIRAALMDASGMVDELVVVDSGSTDETAIEAARAGARVVDIGALLPQVAPVRGKGEALWRSLTAVTGDIVVWIDADIRNFEPHFVTRLIAPLVVDSGTSFVKSFYRRPLSNGDGLQPSGGGRVTELLARPLLTALFPELAGFLQPLAGEYAGRRDVLRTVPFFTGYGVEVGLLIDLLDRVGLDALAQVDLDERVHRNRPLEELAPMAYAIGQTILRRAEEWGRVKAMHDYPTIPLLLPDGEGNLEPLDVTQLERPPIAVLASSLEQSEPVAALP